MATEPDVALNPAVGRPVASVQFICPRCEEMFACGPDTLCGSKPSFSCPHCQLGFHGRPAKFSIDAPVERCLVCGNEEFYVQKDFNRELGLMIVMGSAILVFLVMLVIHHILGIVCLLAVAVIDWVVYRQLANVTVCYLCQSIYRGFPLNPAHTGFYLGNEEKYKKRRNAWTKALLGGT